MKKSVIFVGLLAIGYANAQYEGTVGINTDKPQATLDIIPEATNLNGTTNEGIIAPRLSKTRIANIEASKLTEGTLVYATDDAASPIASYTGSDVKVAKITEKGYYYYDGTEWVKAGVGTTGTDIRNIYTHDGTLSGDRIMDMDGKNLMFRNQQNSGELTFSLAARTPIINLQAVGGGWEDDVHVNSYGDTGDAFSLFINKFRGVPGAPKIVQVGDRPGSFWFNTYNGAGDNAIAKIYTVVSEVDATKNLVKGDLVFEATKNVGIDTNTPTNKLHVKANENPLRLEGLTEGTGTTLVVDVNGVVKKGTGDSSKIASTTGMECNADNRGKMNFVQGADGKSDIFGICMKNGNGSYYWGYMVGGNNPTNGTGAFGSGL